MNEAEFIKEINKLGIYPNAIMLEKLRIYCDYLLEYNTHTNLTAIKTKEDVYLKHFYDSISIIKVIDLTKNYKLLDIGTGAGFPGMVLKIFFPNLDITLLDSNNKKIKFLASLLEKLKLEVNLVNKRAEEYIVDHREEFDIVTSRAVADLRILSELSIPYLRINGLFIPFKSEIAQEIENSKIILNLLNSEIINEVDFNLPIINHKRRILVIKKKIKNNIKYPRPYNKMLKELKH